jgi:Divergent InlB B-repeat domain
VLAAPPDPPRNLPLGFFPAACYERPETPGPTSPECEDAAIYYLDRARSELGLPPYALPADFTALSPDRQLFILANLDRLAYSLPVLPGLSAALTVAAEEGMKAERDPLGVQEPPWWPLFYGSDWAAFPNAIWGYYVWMYSDESVQWGHRHVVFLESLGDLGMGASSGISSNGRESSTLIIESATAPPPFYYTWAEAVASGAGSNAYNPGIPQFAVTLTFAGTGTGSGNVTGSFSCSTTCAQHFPAGTKIVLTATPSANSTFGGWGGACSGVGACEFTVSALAAINANFDRAVKQSTPTLDAAPEVKLLNVRISRRGRIAIFAFKTVGANVRFQCALTRQAAKHHRKPRMRFAPCTSPKTYKRLRPGRYVFAVRALASSGLVSLPIEERFKIR